MAERSLRMEEKPNFDTWPGPESPATDSEAYVAGRGATGRGAGQQRAESIGSTVGQAVGRARVRVDGISRELKGRFRVIRGRASETRSGGVDQIKDAAERGVTQARSRANEKLYLARNRFERIRRERPEQIIIGALAAAFALGMLMRIWRSNRD